MNKQRTFRITKSDPKMIQLSSVMVDEKRLEELREKYDVDEDQDTSQLCDISFLFWYMKAESLIRGSESAWLLSLYQRAPR